MKQINWNDLRDRAYKTAKEHGFHEGKESTETALMLVITELAEAVEADRKGRFHFTKTFSKPKEIVEEWKPIKGYEDIYEVSTFGRIKSKDMFVWNGKAYYRKNGRILKPGLGGTGYYTVSLKGKTHKVAKLVADAFLIKETDKDVVNHIDGNKTNDNLSNLEFISSSQNERHAYATGLKSTDSFQKLTYEQKCEIAYLHKFGIAYTTIYKNNDYGVSKSAIQRVCNEYIKYTDSVEFELADVAIRLLDLAGLHKIDLSDRFIIAYIVNKKKPFVDNCYKIVKDICNYKYTLEEMINYEIRQIYELASFYNINLIWHIEQKMRFNELRKYKHGKEY
jgi:hypothetical protein